MEKGRDVAEKADGVGEWQARGTRVNEKEKEKERRRSWKKKESVSFRSAIPNGKEVNGEERDSRKRDEIKAGTCGKGGKVREGRDKE